MLSHWHENNILFLQTSFFCDYSYKTDTPSERETCGVGRTRPQLPVTNTRLFKYIENFTTKNWKFSDKNSDIFHVSAINMSCEYSLVLSCRGGSNEYQQSMLRAKIYWKEKETQGKFYS